MRFFTIAHASRLPHARVLARRLDEHHGARLTVLALARKPFAVEDEAFDVIWPEDLDVPGWRKLALDFRWEDLVEFFKPHVLSRLLGEGADAAIYLDATVDVHAPLDPVTRELERHGAVVAPRLLGDLPVDGHRPDHRDLRRAGRHGASMIALGRRTVSVRLVGWWAERLTRSVLSIPAGSASEPGRARRGLTRWIDLAPSLFGDLSVLADSGSAVSYWNLHERRLDHDGEGVTVDGRVLRFVHHEGFDPSRPYLLSAMGDRVRASASPLLAELCESYAGRLIEAGWRDLRRRSDVGRRLPNGMAFDDRLSHLLAEAAGAGEELGDVFTPEGAEAFMRWLEEPAPYGGESGVNRYLYGIYRQRPDLRDVYPDLDGSHGDGFTGWARVFGAKEMGIPERFLPDRQSGARPRASAAENGSAARRPPLPRGDKPDLSVEVTGLLTGTLGLGEAARGYVRALQATGIPVSTSSVDVEQFVKLRESPHAGYARVDYERLDGAGASGFRLVCLNPDELPTFADSVGERFFSERPAIGVWAWETDHIPQRWSRAFGLLDEIWVYSTYVADNLGRAAPIPVRRVPPPVLAPEPGEVELDLGVPEGFQFLFMFDFFSTIQRKNPVGLVNAFRLAFEPGDGPQLVIKTINGVHRPDALEELMWAARGRPDVHVVDRSLSPRERDALVAGCDCYVSLHRSEGFGLTLAECMALGKPVIGTAFSAPTDFMTEENSYLVPWRPRLVGADCEIYPADGTWAEPDVAEAARLMCRVIEEPAEARRKGALARRDIEAKYSPPVVGELIRTRLEEIRAAWDQAPPRPPSLRPLRRRERAASR